VSDINLRVVSLNVSSRTLTFNEDGQKRTLLSEFPCWVLKDFQIKIGQRRQKMVEYICLNSFILDPLNVVAKAINLNGQAIFRWLQLSDHQRQIGPKVFIGAQILMCVFSKQSDVGEVPSID